MFKCLRQSKGFRFSSLQVKSPYSGETVYEIEKINLEKANQILEQTAAKQKIFKSSSIQQRIEIVQEAMKSFKNDEEDISLQISQSMGKPQKQAKGELKVMLDRMDTLINMCQQELEDEIIKEDKQTLHKITKEPLGNILCIAPWNYPLITVVNVLTAGILSGNSVLIKHSPYTATIGQVFQKAFQGEPQLVVDLPIDIPICKQIMQNPLVDMVSFTGSVQSGLTVLEQAQEHHYTFNNKIIPVGLELGGKDGFYVRDDVEDLRAVAEALIDGAVYNSGQSCCSVERIYVHTKVYDQFVQHCQDIMNGLYKLGDPLDPMTNLGPMTLPAAPQQLQQQVEDSVSSGAQLLVGGLATNDREGKGNFFEPTLLVDCDNGQSVFQEESFGPVVAVGRVQDDVEALQMINDTKYGLTAGVYTSDYQFAMQFNAQVNAGTVFMNKCDYLEPTLPWAARKLSGRGVALSRHAFDSVTQLKGYNFNK